MGRKPKNTENQVTENQVTENLSTVDEKFAVSTQALSEAIESNKTSEEQSTDAVVSPIVEEAVKQQPTKNEVDENGLFTHIKYHFKDNGRKVDWLKMIPREYFVPNKANFIKRGEPVPETTEGVGEKDLLILLDGFKYIAELRRYSAINYSVSSSPEHCTVVCSIDWEPNFESGENNFISRSGIGDANFNNTKGFGRLFLGPVAENRAFVRAVRNFLRIPVLGSDEVSGVVEDESDETASVKRIVKQLEKLMSDKNVSFEMIKSKLVKEGVKGASEFHLVSDLPSDIVFDMIERLKKKKS